MKNKPTNEALTFVSALPVVRTPDTTEILFGAHPPLKFPIDDNGNVIELDPAFCSGNGALNGSGSIRLKHISACLKACGKNPESDADIAWFNKNVRDPYHKALKYLNRQFIKDGTPIGLTLSKRTSKVKATLGEQSLDGTFKYRVTLKKGEDTRKTLADAKEKEKSNGKRRARRQSRKGLNNGLAKLDTLVRPDTTAAPTETPKPETVTA